MVLPPLLARRAFLRHSFVAFRKSCESTKSSRCYVFGLTEERSLEDWDGDPFQWPTLFHWHSTAALFDGSVTDELVAKVKALQRWFDSALLGKAMGGRPTGTGEFPTSGAFVQACVQAALRLTRCGSKVTQDSLAESLGETLGGLCVPRETFRYWRRKHGFETWAELREYLREATQDGR